MEDTLIDVAEENVYRDALYWFDRYFGVCLFIIMTILFVIGVTLFVYGMRGIE